jgi:hypothetical protein
MDCSEVRDIIDAHALGAGTPEDAALIESHVAECVECWNELGKAQRTAALLALSAPMVDVPDGLEDRIMSVARQETEMETKERPEPQPPLLQRLGFSWASAAAGLGVASVAALAFAGILQAEVNDLRGENTRIEAQMRGTTQELEASVRDANDAADTAGGILISIVSTSPQKVEMKPSADSTVFYTSDADREVGWVICDNLADPPDGMVYLFWFNADTVNVPAVPFMPDDGGCQIPLDLTALTMTPTGVGLSLEELGTEPNGPDHWLDYAHFPIEN